VAMHYITATTDVCNSVQFRLRGSFKHELCN